MLYAPGRPRWALRVRVIEGQRPELLSSPGSDSGTGWTALESVANGEQVTLQAVVGAGTHVVWEQQPGSIHLRLRGWEAKGRGLIPLFDLQFTVGKIITDSQQSALMKAPEDVRNRVSKFVGPRET